MRHLPIAALRASASPVIAVALGIALIVAVGALALRYPASIWAIPDYGLDSLSGALNLAYRLGDLRFYPAPSMENHPGVPQYLLSWIGLALAGFPRATSSLAFFNDAVDHVERFHAIMIGLLALSGAFGVVLFIRVATKIVPVGATIFAILLWLVSTPQSLLSFLLLSIDSFGLILTALFVDTLWRIANKPMLDPSIMIVAGAVGAAAYLTKLSYIALPIGLCAAMGLMFVVARSGRVRITLMALVSAYAFVTFVSVVALLFIEWRSFRALLSFHLSVINGTGLYGTESPVVSSSQIWDAILAIPADRTYAVAIAIIAGPILIGASVLTAFFKKDQQRAVFLMGVGVATSFSGFSVLKHYSAYYSAGVACILPATVVAVFVLLDAWNVRLRRKVLIGSGTATIMFLLAIPIVLHANNTMAGFWRRSLDAKEDYKVVAAHIGTQPIGFAYAAPFREYGEGFLLVNVGVPQLTFQYLAEQTKAISSSLQHLVRRNIGVFVIDKARFPTVDAVKASSNFNLLGPTEKYQVGDELTDLRTVFLLVRKSAPAGTGEDH